MKAKFSIARIIIIAVYFGISLLGVFVGMKIFRDYQIVVNGILALVIFYLIYQEFVSSRMHKVPTNEDIFFEFPKVKYFVFTFFWTLIMYWAYRQISTMISYFLGR